MATSKLDTYADEIFLDPPPGTTRTQADKAIAKKAKVTIGAVRAYRSRNKATSPASKAPPSVAAKAKELKAKLKAAKKAPKTFTKAKKIKAAKKAPATKAKTSKKTEATAPTALKKVRPVPDDGILLVIPEAGVTCPKCSTHASKDEDEVNTLFGFRKVAYNGGHKRIPQSGCRPCRSASNRKAAAKKLARSNSAEPPVLKIDQAAK
jgi:hypothetical protein